MKAAQNPSIRPVKSRGKMLSLDEMSKKISFYAEDQYRTASERLAGGKALRWTYVRISGQAQARAHARSGDAATISGYMGSSESIDDAISEFALENADQSERDCRAFVRTVRDCKGRRSGRILEFYERRNCRPCFVRKIAGNSCDRQRVSPMCSNSGGVRFGRSDDASEKTTSTENNDSALEPLSGDGK
jgi:hypothetical protein